MIPAGNFPFGVMKASLIFLKSVRVLLFCFLRFHARSQVRMDGQGGSRDPEGDQVQEYGVDD
jgi:hypothetical protein